tara:strand:+ start:427 stop:582 length:156 start_codon:yes stop_codon:yes gene_type:complete
MGGLTATKQFELFDDYRQGMSIKLIKEKYNVSIPYIYKILKENDIDRDRAK